MPIPADHPIKAGHYVLDSDPGRPQYACNCPGSKLTLRTIAANRGAYSVWPAPATKPIQVSATFTPAELANGARS